MLMFSFTHSILLWSFNTWQLMNDTLRSIKRRKGKFKSIIWPKHLIGTLNCVKIMWKNDWIKVEASDSCFNKYTPVHLLWSSTKVRKYLDPFKEGVEYGPQMSAWTKSKQDKEMLEEWVKGNLCCLAKGQMWQSKGIVLL